MYFKFKKHTLPVVTATAIAFLISSNAVFAESALPKLINNGSFVKMLPPQLNKAQTALRGGVLSPDEAALAQVSGEVTGSVPEEKRMVMKKRVGEEKPKDNSVFQKIMGVLDAAKNPQ